MVTATERTRLSFPVKGMHCAGCVAKVERALRGVEGVAEANVNLATERATVWVDPGAPGLPAMRQAVEGVGYTIPTEIARTAESEKSDREARAAEDRRLRLKVWVGAVLSVPVLIGSMHEVLPWAPAWLPPPRLPWAPTHPRPFLG